MEWPKSFESRPSPDGIDYKCFVFYKTREEAERAADDGNKHNPYGCKFTIAAVIYPRGYTDFLDG